MFNNNQFIASQMPYSGSALPFTIKRLICVVTRDNYADVYQRSYSLNVTTDGLRRLENMVSPISHFKHNINPLEVCNYTPDIITVNPSISGQVKIPNGWQTKRLRFIMEVEYSTPVTRSTAYIQGFTDNFDPSISGTLDPGMMFNINSILTVKKIVDPITNKVRVVPSESYNVVSDLACGDVAEGIIGNDLVTIRPYDIHQGFYVGERYSAGEVTVKNIATGISSASPKVSRKVNSNPYKYFTNTINGFINAQQETEISHGTDDIYKSATAQLREPDLLDIPFIASINRVTGEFVPTKFTLGTLMAIDPTINSRIDVYERDNIGIMQNYTTMLDTDYTQSALQPIPINLKATFIANSLPTLLLETLLTKAELSFTNMSGEPVVVVASANSFIADLDISTVIDGLVNKIKLYLFPQVSDYNQSLIECHVSCDILGDITVGLTLNGNGPVIYRFPVFADSLYTPVICKEDLSHVVTEDYSNIMDAVGYGANSFNSLSEVAGDTKHNNGIFY